MAKGLRADCIRCCISCFTCVGKPCGKAGRATAVFCGVRLSQLAECCMGCFKLILVLVVLLVAGFFIYVYWDQIAEATSIGLDAIVNATIQVDPNTNKTISFYNATDDQMTSVIDAA